MPVVGMLWSDKLWSMVVIRMQILPDIAGDFTIYLYLFRVRYA